MEKNEKELWMNYAYVISSTVRKKIILSLSEKPLTPTQIAEETSLNLSQVSRNLKKLSEKKLVECLNPDEKKGRLYHLLEEGEWVEQKIDE